MQLESVVKDTGFDILFYDNPQPMWVFNADTLQIIEVNAAAILQYGYTKQEFLNRTITELRPKEDIAILNQFLKSLQGHNPNYHEFRHQAKNGSIFFVEIHSYSIIYNGVDARLVHAYNIQERKDLSNELANIQLKLEKILETINVGFCQLDDEQRITYWNTAAEELLGYKRKDVHGKKLWEVLPEVVNTDFYNLLQWSIDKKEDVDFLEYFWPLQKWLSITAHSTAHGQTIHFKDSTSKIQFQKSLLKKIEQLKDVSFLNSHLIRKPVASLLGLTNLIKEDIICPDEYKTVAQYIHECSIELDEVVNQVNKKVNEDTQSGLVISDLFNFPIFTLLKEIKSEFDSKGSTNNLLLSDKTQNVEFYGNRKAIKSAINCLIDNAVKYSFQGSTIIIRAQIIEQNLVIALQDFGSGIDKEMLNRLFLGLTNLEHFKNLGPGLTLVADVVKDHNGTVLIESEKTIGSIFTLRFPLSNIAAYLSTGVPNFNIYKKPIVDIDINSKRKYVIANYKGFHDTFSMKAGSEKLLDVITQHTYHKILIDDTELLGVWDGAVEWITNEWFPMAEQAGITHVAVVYSKSAFSRASADHIAHNLNAKIKYKTFYDKDNAVEWLANYPPPYF